MKLVLKTFKSLLTQKQIPEKIKNLRSTTPTEWTSQWNMEIVKQDIDKEWIVGVFAKGPWWLSVVVPVCHVFFWGWNITTIKIYKLTSSKSTLKDQNIRRSKQQLADLLLLKCQTKQMLLTRRIVQMNSHNSKSWRAKINIQSLMHFPKWKRKNDYFILISFFFLLWLLINSKG